VERQSIVEIIWTLMG